jgi:hypothetical protein
VRLLSCTSTLTAAASPAFWLFGLAATGVDVSFFGTAFFSVSTETPLRFTSSSETHTLQEGHWYTDSWIDFKRTETIARHSALATGACVQTQVPLVVDTIVQKLCLFASLYNVNGG